MPQPQPQQRPQIPLPARPPLNPATAAPVPVVPVLDQLGDLRLAWAARQQAENHVAQALALAAAGTDPELLAALEVASTALGDLARAMKRAVPLPEDLPRSLSVGAPPPTSPRRLSTPSS